MMGARRIRLGMVRELTHTRIARLLPTMQRRNPVMNAIANHIQEAAKGGLTFQSLELQ
jgi:hypothetical protein